MRTFSKAALAFALCCGAACNTNNPVGTKYAAQQAIQASQGGSVTVTQADVANSTAAALAGTAIAIPPSALSADATIYIAAGEAFANATAVGPVAVFSSSIPVTFSHQTTITLPFALTGGLTTADVAVQGLDASGNIISVPNSDLKIDAAASTVSFTAVGLISFGCVSATAVKCPAGEQFCGCCGNGSCVPDGQPCATCNIACPVDGGTGGGGGSCCPAGETFCGCGNTGVCLPAGQPCLLECPVQQGGSSGSAVPPPPPVCCPPGTYLCGCGGSGQCIPDNQACPLLCPVCDPPNTFPTPCGCLPPGATCACDPTQASTEPCQCDPTTATSSGAVNPGGPVCIVDGGSICPPNEILSPCGCIPPTAFCVPPPDAGCISATAVACCDGQCVGPGQACPNICFADGGTGAVDGGICPSSTNRCPDGKCVPPGTPCP